MARPKGGLGKGLDALFADNDGLFGSEESPVSLKLSDIEPNPDQPRKLFDEEKLMELAKSISEHGLIQPILVSPLSNGRYQLVAGERRWRACRIAGLVEVPVIIKQLSEKEKKEIALIENLQREDLNPIETAYGIQALIEEYGLTQDQAAERVGCSRPAIANSLRLINLPKEVKELTRNGKISAGHARALLAFKDEDKMIEAAHFIAKNDVSVREVERMAKRAASDTSAPLQTAKKKKRDSFFDEVELSLTETLGRKVKVYNNREKGTLEIEFYNKDDLKSIANLLSE